ncbi:MAG: outer membrane protein assembly factor BamE [Candidatus Sedimenticola endophacoides]
MQKLLISCVCAATLLGGCSTARDIGDSMFEGLTRLSVIHTPDIQQGNVVTQEDVNGLEPGMTKSQVRYLLGTPLLVDVFHQERWDYVYSMREGRDEPTRQRIALYFDDDRLTRIEVDLRPLPAVPETQEQKETVVSVPDYEPREKGIFDRALETVGIETNE